MTDGTGFPSEEAAGTTGGDTVPPAQQRPRETPLLPQRLPRADPAPPSRPDHARTALVPRAGHAVGGSAPPLADGVTGAEAEHDGGAVIGMPEVTALFRRHGVVLGGLALIAAQLVWKAYFLSHFFFWQDDYHYLDRALENRFSWSYLSYVGAGHLIPGPYAIAWALSRVALYDWALATAVTLAIVAAAGLALLRLLRNLFGDRPTILIPLAIYLLTPLTLPDLGWWSSAIESVPLQLAAFMALDVHVRYVRTGRARHAVIAGVWLAAGMFFFEKGVVVPLLLFAVTSAFLMDGRWGRAALHCLVRYSRAWLGYGAVLVAYLIILAFRLQTSNVKPASPGTYRNVLSFMTELVKNTFVPGALGGPWQWLPNGALAYSSPPQAMVWLAWISAVAIVVVSIVRRRHAWRAWAILAGWLVLADMMPVVLGRIGALSGATLGLETRYVADAAPVLAICLALAFWPVAGRPDQRRLRLELAGSHQIASAAGTALMGVFVFGSLWSAQAYQSATTSAPARAFIANARAALAAAPPGTVVVDQHVPDTVILAIFGSYADTSKVVGYMARGKAAGKLHWVGQPVGTVDRLLAFGPDGLLHNVGILGTASTPLPPGKNCWPARKGRITLPFREVTTQGTATLHFAYFAFTVNARWVTVTFGGQAQRLLVKPGPHGAYLTVRGSGSGVTVSGLAGWRLCAGNAEIGAPLPMNSGPTIPALPTGGGG